MATATKSTGIYVRVDPKTKSEVENVFNDMGITTSRAVNMFLTKVAKEKRIPFTLSAVPHVKYLDEMSNDEIIDMVSESYKRIEDGEYITGEEFIDYLEGLDKSEI